jgi:hypothetical protein
MTHHNLDGVVAACRASGNPLSEAHVRALHNMHDAVAADTADAVLARWDRQELFVAPNVCLADVLAAYAFQHILRELARGAVVVAAAAPRRPPFRRKREGGHKQEPRFLFHPCFFSFLRNETNAAANGPGSNGPGLSGTAFGFLTCHCHCRSSALSLSLSLELYL